MPSFRISEFGCGHSVRTGSQIICWLNLIICFSGLQVLNYYYYDTKKVKLTQSPLTLILLDLLLGIYASLLGLYGIYFRKRIWIKQFVIYLFSQFFLASITTWIYYIYIYPTQPPNPKKTRYVILTTIWVLILVFGFIAYSLITVWSHYSELEFTNELREDRRYLIEDNTNSPAQALVNDDAQSSVSGFTSTTIRTFKTSAPNAPIYNNFNPPDPHPQEFA